MTPARMTKYTMTNKATLKPTNCPIRVRAACLALRAATSHPNQKTTHKL